MKSIRILLALVAVVLAAVLVTRDVMFAWVTLFAASAALAPAIRTPQLTVTTLVVPLLTQEIFKAIRTRVVALNYISTDFTPDRVKWEQEIISKQMIAPTAIDHKPGNNLLAGGTNTKTLSTDVRIRINRGKAVLLELPSLDASTLFASDTFLRSVNEAAVTLGRAILTDVFSAFNSQNFSHETRIASGSQDFDTLSTATELLNLQGADAERYFIAGSSYIKGIGSDPRMQSSDYKAAMLQGDPYRRYSNVEGFTEVAEWPAMPTNNVTIGTFTANASTEVITLGSNALSSTTFPIVSNGDRVRLTTSGTLPANLAINTDYYVISLDKAANTLKLAATPGGSAIDIGDTGSGTHTLSRFEALNAVAFAKSALHLAVRPMEDNADLARQLGIPQLYTKMTETDPETGLTLTVFMYEDPGTGKLTAAVYAFYGFAAGRGLGCDPTTNPVAATLAADSYMDPQGLRIVETATSA